MLFAIFVTCALIVGGFVANWLFKVWAGGGMNKL